MTRDLVLVNGLILADPDSAEVRPHGKTLISGTRLDVVNSPNDSSLEAESVIDCSDCLILPGLINGHTHSPMSLLRGMADDLPLERWLNDYIFPSEWKYVAPDFVYLGTMVSAAEMALGGTTTFADGYFFMEHAAKAAINVGLRAVIAQGILDVPAPDAPVPGSWKHRAESFLSSCPRDSLVTPALFCHSPYLCGPETLQESAELAAGNCTLLFSHVCETGREVEAMSLRYGRTPVEHLKNLGVLGSNFVAIHAVHLSDGEKETLAQTGTKVVHCPESNMKLASGPCPAWDLQRRGVIVGIGTDGPASNNNLDLFEEMRSASLMAKLITGDPEALGARSVLRMATKDGARALGMEQEIGSLEPGKLADVIVIDLDRFHLTPLYDEVSHLVYSARGSDVRDVIVNGRIIVREGRIITVDGRELKARARDKALKIGQDLARSTRGAS